jgi:hypothetical protein
MERKMGSWRIAVSLFVALVFAIAAMPGSMAISAPMAQLSWQGEVGQPMSCHDMAPQPKVPQKACKGVCLGMLTCYGMGVLPVWGAEILPPSECCSVIYAHNSVSGLSIPPDDRPPIA